MIAIKQNKPSPISNKIQEKSIKNRKATQPQAAATTASDKTIVSESTDQREESTKTKNSQAQQQPQRSTTNHTIQQQSNETRSEIKQIERGLQATASTQASNLPPSSPLAPKATSATMANATTSLMNASSKIQQRQQKFLAAAAKCTTSPQHYNHHQARNQHNLCQMMHHSGSMVSCSTDQRDKVAFVSASDDSVSCCSNAMRKCQLDRQEIDRKKLASNEHPSPVRCCPFEAKSDVVVPDVSVSSDNDVSRNIKHLGEREQRTSTASCCDAASAGISAQFTTTRVTNIANGRVCDRAGDKTSSELSEHQQRHQRPAGAICSAIDCAQGAKITGLADAGSARGESSATAINEGDTRRELPRRGCDGTENQGFESAQHRQQLSQHHHLDHLNHNKHQHQQPDNQLEVRRSCEQKEDKGEGDNINVKKNSIKHNHHYFNRNNQHHYPHLQYQPTQQIITTQAQSTIAHANQPQQVMAHYKFHNDCQSSVLTYEQVKRLDLVMDQVVPIHGRGNAPTLFVKLKELIRSVKHKLQHEHSIEIRDVRLNGGVASYVLAPENSHYNDLDLVFGTDLSNEDRFDVIRDVVLECLMEFYPKGNEQHQQKTESALHQDQNTCRGHFSQVSLIGSSQAVVIDDQNVESIDEDVHSEEDSNRSSRSSSFESDNLNITTNESNDDSDEDNEDNNIIVRIDSDDSKSGDRNSATHDANEIEKTKPNSGQTLNKSAADSVDAQVGGDFGTKNANASQKIAMRLNSSPQKVVQYQYVQMPPNSCAIREAYVHKMVKVNDDDRWSLISLGVQRSETNNYNHIQHQQQRTEAAESLLPCPQSASTVQQSAHNHESGHEGCLQNQLPNSIELKFVDRMRRKFEFSVDSFQIILDSLIQFYDYAPQSTITIQRKHPGSPSSMVDVHPMINRRSSCGHCCGFQILPHASPSMNGGDQEQDCGTKTQVIDKFLEGSIKKKKHTRQFKSCGETSLNGSRSYYDLPLEPSNSLSNSSVASSSGCSSSSSVVSSSSSSLSCDEDSEDLYCDAGNSSSSSASTSSLLSATTGSVISSATDELCDPTLSAKSHLGHTSDASTTGEYANQKLNISKETKKHTSENDCVGRKGAIERDFELSKPLSCAVISENFYPTVIGRSEYGNFKEALYHLEKKLIATRSPEEIRGGGLLKYCNLLVKNYKPTNVLQIRTLERYMCSRFFIDFSDLNQQRAKLESYLANHFSDDPMQKFHYLTILHNVVQRSTVCLMNHELRLTLNMIRELAYELNEQHQGQSQHQTQAAQQRAMLYQQPTFSQASRQQADQQHQQQYHQKPKHTVMQSGVYRVKLVNYALAKPIKP